jgi:hypothetical protein
MFFTAFKITFSYVLYAQSREKPIKFDDLGQGLGAFTFFDVSGASCWCKIVLVL